MPQDADGKGLAWQVGVWDRMARPYVREVDRRFASVVEGVIERAALRAGERVLDLGTGTAAVAIRAASIVTPAGHVTGVDISAEMLARAGENVSARGLSNVTLREGRAEAIPAESSSCDVVLASLSLMYAIDRAAAAREIARVLRPAGRFVAAVWAGPAECDIVMFQQLAGSFALAPPVPGVGPGALADTKPFMKELEDAGIRASVDKELLGFDFDDFESAWDVLAAVTTADLQPERRDEARAAVRSLMWPSGEGREGRDGPRHFRNTTQFIVGTASMDLQTRSLRLVPQTREDVGRMIEAMSPSERAQLSADWMARFQASVAPDPWIHGFRMVHRDTGIVVGAATFKGPPAEGVVEIAYGVAPDQQRRGYATEAAQALVAFAFSSSEVRVVRAHTLPDSLASQRVLAKCGFRNVGTAIDPDDGLVWRFERAASQA